MGVGAVARLQGWLRASLLLMLTLAADTCFAADSDRAALSGDMLVGVQPVTTTATLRAAILSPPPSGIVILFIPEGLSLPLEGRPLHAVRSNVTLRSLGQGATLDAGGVSRHFEVADGGSLHLDRVHLVNGGLVTGGGCVRLGPGSTLTAQDSVLSHCTARSADGTAVQRRAESNPALISAPHTTPAALPSQTDCTCP